MIRKAIFGFAIISLMLILSSCMQRPDSGNPVSSKINEAISSSFNQNKQISNHSDINLPSVVNQALVPDINLAAKNQYNPNEKQFDISVKNVPADKFFMGLVSGTKYNMIVSPKVKGSITLSLKRVTILQVLQAVHDMYGYQFKSTSYGFQVFPSGMQTRIYIVNYLNVNRSGHSSMVVRSGQITNSDSHAAGATTTGSTPSASGISTTAAASAAATPATPASGVSTQSQNDFWTSLRDTLTSLVGKEKGSKIILNPSAGIIIVRADTDTLNQVANYLDMIQATMTRQVIIEAKILEVKLNKGFQSGIDWSVFGASQSGSSLTSPTGSVQALSDLLGPFTSIFTLKASAGNAFSAAINLLSTQGNVQVLSSPRIATLNNQKAVIKVGHDQFFITNVKSNVSGSGSDTQTSNDVELTPFFSGIALGVTPEISAKGEVILHIHPMITEVTTKKTKFRVNSSSGTTSATPEDELPLALSEVRESDSIVRAKSGQIVVIGGLMQTKTGEHDAATPLLGDLPVVGGLFRRTEQESTKSELVILLKPIVTSDSTWTKQMKKLQSQYKTAEEPFKNTPQSDQLGEAVKKIWPNKS
jgi:MSHA biogenesis protein MshL